MIDGTLLDANARAALLVDGSDDGTLVVRADVRPGASGLKVVIQNTNAAVEMGDELRSVTPHPLGVITTKVVLD